MKISGNNLKLWIKQGMYSFEQSVLIWPTFGVVNNTVQNVRFYRTENKCLKATKITDLEI